VHVVATLHSKGGVGKSCIAVNLARSLQLRGLSVCIIDTDKQGTAQNWQASGDDELPAVYGVSEPGLLENNIGELDGAFDVAVIDGGAHLQKMHAAIVKVSDLVLIPVQPSPADIWPTSTVVELVETRQKLTGSPQAVFVVNRRKTGTRLGKSVRDALSNFSLPVWKGTHDRVAYAEAMGRGISVVESGDEKAAAEIQTLTDNVITQLRSDE